MNSLKKTTWHHQVGSNGSLSSSASLRFQRPQSEINLVSATSREFDLKERLNHNDRKLALHYEAQERLMQRSQKWKYKAEKNNLMRELNQMKSGQVTPTIDDWLKSNVKTRNLSNQDVSKLAR